MREKAGLLLSIFMLTFVIENKGFSTNPVTAVAKVHDLIYTIMSKQKVTNTEQIPTGAVEKSVSENARCRGDARCHVRCRSKPNLLALLARRSTKQKRNSYLRKT